MRASGKNILLAMLILSFTVCTCSQEASFRKLIVKSGTLYQQGQYSEAAEAAEEALKVAEKTFEPDHPDVALSLNILGELYYVQGKYAEAEPLYKRSLTIWEKSLGPNHPKVATVCENMARCYKKLGKVDEAEKLEARARKIRSKR